MKKSLLLLVSFVVFLIQCSLAQINSNSPAVPFGSKTSYGNGIMPNNLPSGGTYGASQAAADAYNAWKTNLTETCTNGARVKFDTQAQTVSEGIGYGMLLSAYAGDKPLFDNLWKYYKANSNSRGLMNWHINGCSGLYDGNSANGATDADEDAAMALVIAAQQWPTATSPYTYKTEATTLIHAIKSYEIASSGQPVNGDGWGTGSAERNPSYMAPAYYTEFAIFDATNASFWNNCASAVSTLLLGNRNATTGLVSNWCKNTSPYADDSYNNAPGYGYDACRNPWRMAVDVLWHGGSAVAASSDICSKLSTWLKGNESNLKGPFTNQTAANPGAGQYRNGTFSTFALAPMGTTSANQASLNSCYTNVVSLGSSESYFSQTLRCINLFTLTGNFWKPGTTVIVPTAPVVTSAATNNAGTTITVNFSTAVTYATTDYSKFTLKIGGTAVSGAITAIAANGTSAVDLTIASGKIVVGNVITLDYTPGSIKSTATTPVALAAYTGAAVTNNLPGSSTMIADCNTGNQTKLLTYWFAFNDASNGGKSTTSPANGSPFLMTAPGANSTDSAAVMTYSLSQGTNTNSPFVGLGFNLTATAGKAYDLSGSTGISFWHKGAACKIQAGMSTVTDYDTYGFSVSTDANWTSYSVKWTQFAQAGWGKAVTFDASKLTAFQWQITGSTGNTGSIGIDEVQIDGKSLTLPTVTPTVTKTALVTALATANSVATNAVVGSGNGQYTSASKTTLQTAITTATGVNTSTTATQAQVDAAVTTLNTAVTTFKNSVIVVTKTALTTAISNATTIKNAAVVGTGNGQYTSATVTTLQNAISAATTVNTNTSASQAQVDAALATLITAVTTFTNSVIVVTKATLAATISSANSAYSNATEGTASGQYPSGSRATLNSEIAAATTVNNNASATQAQVDAANTTLKTALTTFQNSVIGVNKSSLATSISTANATYSAATEGTGDGQYPTGSKATLQSAITAASSVNSNGSATQTQVDAANTTLLDAIATFKKSMIVVSKTNLVTTIASANSTYSAATEGTANGQYPTGSKATLKTAIDAASLVNTNASASQSQVDNANATLLAAIATFQNSVVGVNKVELYTTITNASSIYSSAVEGTADGQYSTGSKATLNNAITSASTVNSNTSATQAQVDAANTDLLAAITTFQNSVVGVNKSALQTSLSTANNDIQLAIEGTLEGQYPTGSKSTLQTAISSANSVFTNASSTQAQVDAANTSLQSAIASFKNSVIKTAIAIENDGQTVYPNPCNDDLQIKTNKTIVSISVYSLLGELQNSVYTNGKSISVQSLATGIYFVKIQFEHNQFEIIRVTKL